MKSNWTVQDMPPMRDKLAVVTGANNGIGFQTALELARAGASMVLACRDNQKATTAAQRIQKEVPGAVVECLPLNLADLSSVHSFAAAMEQQGTPIDLLINNAGVMAVPTRRLTADGFELQFATNHLGHFALTGLLFPLLLRAKNARVVTVSSIAHKSGHLHFDNLNGEKRYKDLAAYNNSKLANLLFAFELQRRAAAAHLPVVSIAAHPGVATTNLFAAGSKLDKQPLFSKLTEMFVPILGQSDVRGALPILFAATSDEARGGEFYGPDGVFQFRGSPTQITPAKQALDLNTAALLWHASEEMTHVTYPLLANTEILAA